MTKKKDKPKKPEPPSTTDPPLDPDARNLPPAPAPSSDEKDDLQKEADIDRPPQAGLILALLLTSEIRFSEIVARFAANPDAGERLVQLAIRRLQKASRSRGLSTKQYLSSLVTFIMELEGALEDC